MSSIKELYRLGKFSEDTIISLPLGIPRGRSLELMNKVPYIGLMLDQQSILQLHFNTFSLGWMKECWQSADFELDKSRSIGSDILGAVCLMWIIKTEISLVRLG